MFESGKALVDTKACFTAVAAQICSSVIVPQLAQLRSLGKADIMAQPEALQQTNASTPARQRSTPANGIFLVFVLAFASILVLTARAAFANDSRGGETAKDASKSDSKDRVKEDAGRKGSDDEDGDESLAEQASERFPQPVKAGSLVHRTVLEPIESQPVLGHVAAVVRTDNGETDIVVDFGGFLGFFTRPIAVPVDAMTLLGRDMEIVGFTPAQLQLFPTFKTAGTLPVPSDQILSVGLSRPSH